MLLQEQINEVFNYQKDYFQIAPTGLQRKLIGEIDHNNDQVKIITGIRRSGKSTLLLQLVQQIGKYNYISFEDPRLTNFEVNDFYKLEKIFQNNNDSKVFFFDEIQNIKGWEQFIRTLHDKKFKVYLSGSNASLLSKELGSSLTGRQISYELFPFSYSEFLAFKNQEKGISSFEEYFSVGGFPEYIKYENPDILIQLFNDLIYRDIITRHGLKNPDIVRELGIYLASNIGKEYSNNKLRKSFSLGSANTVQSYISFFQDAYLFFSINRFSYSLKSQSVNPKKIYGIDQGLMQKLSLSYTKDKGRILENIVFLELLRQKKEIHYFKEEGECDFIVSKNRNIESAIQVCYQINEHNMHRETQGLIEAMKSLKIKKGFILTMDQEDVLKDAGIEISIIPFYKWQTQTSQY